MAVSAGSKLGRYEIRAKIGAGGMGEVYLAEDTQLGRRVAIKLLPAETISDEHARRRLVREARAAAKLDHPNICSIYEVGEEDGRNFIVMQYVEGETLDAKIKRKPLDLSGLLSITTQVTDALAEAHAHGIVHRDIKPSNIIITPRGQAKVMDFGLAKVVTGPVETEAETMSLLTSPGTIMGTMAYMSPEQARGQNLDGRSDIFSLGVVFYEMIAGRKPFEGTTAADVIASMLKVEPPSLAQFGSEVPPELQRIVNKALRKDKEERYQTTRDMLLDLKSLNQELEFEAKRKQFAVSGTGSGAAVAARARRPETKYARSGDVNIAYQVVGSGPVDLVYVMGWVSNLDYFWEEPSYARFLDRLASFSRLILFDKRGTGLSDRVHEAELPTLEQRMDDVRAVMDAVGSERAALFGVSEGGPMCALFAATYPERTSAVVMYGSYAKRVWAPEYPWAPTLEERQKFFDLIGQGWGGVVDASTMAPSRARDEQFLEWWATYLRRSASPGAALAFARMNTQIDITNILPTIRVPTLIVHRTGDLDANVGGARYMAQQIPGAKYVELPGDDHLPWVGDQDAILDEIEQLLAGIQNVPDFDRVLATVLCLHVVGLTGTAKPREDDWQDSFLLLARREFERFRGREVETTKEMLLAAFDGPARAIRAARSIRDSARRLGIESKAGLHTGECDVIDEEIAGIAVEMSAQVAARARAGEVLVSSTVKDLVAGSGIQFEDRGARPLQGVEGKWRLFAVVQDGGSGAIKRAHKPSTRSGRPSRAIDSLAILPLENASADPRMEYLSDGITESIINSLSPLPKLRVMARSTVFRYKGGDIDPQQVGRDLGVRAVFTGRVLQLGDRLVIGTELVDVADGSQLWGEQYNRGMADIFALQEEISRQISEKLRLKLSGAEKKRLTKRHTRDNRAYELYLKGRFFWNKRTEEDAKRGIECFQQALSLDQNFALAYAGLADCQTVLGDVGVQAMLPKEAFSQGQQSAARALELDKTLAEPHATMGHINMHLFEWPAAEKEFQSAIELNPNYAQAYVWHAYYCAFNHQFVGANAAIKRALALDPLSLPVNTSAAELLHFAGRFDESIEQFRRAQEMDPHYFRAPLELARVYEHLKMFDEALSEFSKARELSNDGVESLASVAHFYAVSGRRTDALALLRDLTDLSERQYVSPFDLALIHGALGQKEQAFEWLNRAYEIRDGWMIYITVDPRWQSLRKDARFIEIVQRVGLPQQRNRKIQQADSSRHQT